MKRFEDETQTRNIKHLQRSKAWGSDGAKRRHPLRSEQLAPRRHDSTVDGNLHGSIDLPADFGFSLSLVVEECSAPCVLPGDDPQGRQRFREQSRITALLSEDPRIVVVRAALGTIGEMKLGRSVTVHVPLDHKIEGFFVL